MSLTRIILAAFACAWLCPAGKVCAAEQKLGVVYLVGGIGGISPLGPAAKVALPLILPQLEVTRDVGVSLYAALLLWLLACAAMLRGDKVAAGEDQAREGPPSLAA